MILFILNDYLKPPKAQRNLSIRHSGLCKGTQSKNAFGMKRLNRLTEKQRGMERNFLEPPAMSAHEEEEGLGEAMISSG